MTSSAKRVAIIGGGASGLTATKCCVDEGLQPTLFERTDDIGGLWHFTDDVRENQACVMRSTVINTSKELMCFSDFPIPEHYPNLMHNRYVLSYLQLYAKNFDLEKYVKFKHEIKLVTPTADHDVTGQWSVTVQDHSAADADDETLTFDAVMVCTGHHASKRVPSFPGQERFQGRIVHTHDYKDHRGLEQKNVVVVGVGNSGLDVAAELAKIANQVYLSTRRGVWLGKKSVERGMPWDVVALRRAQRTIGDLLGPNLLADIMEKKANEIIDHKAFGLQPKHRIWAQHGTASDDLPYAILAGQVKVKPNIREFKETSVVFDDGVEVDADAVVLATGYKFGFPFVDPKILEVHDNQIELYKYVFPPNASQRGTLAVIGCVQPIGALFPISEMHSRWATRVFKGLSKLPSRDVMMTDIKQKQLLMRYRYVNSARHTIQVDWIPYMDEIAEQIGCKPDISKYLLSDPRLALQLFFGPCCPYQYRLQGPLPWSGARNALMTCMDRVNAAFKTRAPESLRPESIWTLRRLLLACLFGLYVLYAFICFAWRSLFE